MIEFQKYWQLSSLKLSCLSVLDYNNHFWLSMNRSGENNRKTNDSSSYSGKAAFSTSSLVGPRDKPAKGMFCVI